LELLYDKIFDDKSPLVDTFVRLKPNLLKPMNQYIITAYDGSDENALERRMSVRPFHLEGVKKLKEKGNFIIGGAILNDDGKMIGSTMILQFEDPKELQDWIDQEPYIQQKVWEKFEVKPFRVANV
jgi:uncharacterized protein